MKKLLILPMLLFSTMTLYSQIEVKYFNAGWNAANEVTWVEKLSDCEIDKFDIGADPKKAQEFKVVVVPTIIIFQDGEEVERYQADISFKMEATREELQDYIDELIMSAF
jgi:hypothetical protein